MPTTGHAAAHAVLRYRVVQGWLRDETACGTVKIQQAINCNTHTGQTEVALPVKGRHGGLADALVVTPNGMVLVFRGPQGKDLF